MAEGSSARRRKGDEGSKKAPGKKDDTNGEKARPFQGRYNPKASDRYGSVSHKSIAKFVMLLGVVVFMVYQGRKENTQSMAKVDEVVSEKRKAQMLCAPSYRKEIEAFDPVCVPSKCGRFIVDELISVSEAHKVLGLAKKGLSKGGGSGGASILDLHSGALSQGEKFINVYTAHPNLFTQEDFQLYKTVKDKVKAAVAEHFNLDNQKLYLSHPTFFSELTGVPAVTPHDEYWHAHIDKETYPSFHFTSLLYLSDYKRDFEGGRFMFMDQNMKVNRSIEPKEGRVSAFTSGVENKHFVEPVTGGTRYALTMGFTCDKKSAIKDPGL